MPIAILQEPEDISNNDILECCVFCNIPTPFWAMDIKINRPICPVCAEIYEDEDLATAKYNY